MVIKGHYIRIAAKRERVRRMEDVVVALAEHLCNCLRPGIPDFFPVVLAGCTHVVMMADRYWIEKMRLSITLFSRLGMALVNPDASYSKLIATGLFALRRSRAYAMPHAMAL